MSGTATQAQAVTIDDLAVTTPTTITGPAGAAYSTGTAQTLSGTSPNLTNQSAQSLSSRRTPQAAASSASSTPRRGPPAPARQPTAAWPTAITLFAVRAVDADGFAAPAATYSWTVDTTPPAVTISGDPSDGSITSAKDAAFNLSSSESASFECQLDGAAGTALRRVRELDRAWPTEATTWPVEPPIWPGTPDPLQHRTWTIDATAPDTTATATPDAHGTQTNKQMTIAMSSTEPGTFGCSLDAAAWSACTSPLTLSGLADGQHSFAVKATDRAGNTDATPATTTWTTTPPVVFDLRTTKPTAQNVGAGIVRPAPTKLATSADGTWKSGVLTITKDLKDRVVNGTVNVAADGVTIENCDIRGDAYNAPTGPRRMVNTNGARTPWSATTRSTPRSTTSSSTRSATATWSRSTTTSPTSPTGSAPARAPAPRT